MVDINGDTVTYEFNVTNDNVDEITSGYLVWYTVVATGVAIKLKLELNVIVGIIRFDNDEDGQ